jgi:hypothetical protein
MPSESARSAAKSRSDAIVCSTAFVTSGPVGSVP